MTTPVRGPISNATLVAAEIDAQLSNLYDQLAAWRQRVSSASATDSLDACNIYELLTSTRAGVDERAGAGKDSGGVSQAFIAAYPTHQDGVWHGGQEWAANKAALDPLIGFLKDNWPQKSANGAPAWRTVGPEPNFQLVSFNVPFGAGQKNTLVGLIDAVLATFTPV